MTLVSLVEVYKYDVTKPYNVEIKNNECIMISGKNGCGKTTLIKLILGFIKPDRGFVKSQKLKIAYLPERLKLPFFMQAYVYLRLQEKMKKTIIEPKLLHLFNVPLFRYVHQLSKGNKQKLGIMITLMGKPDLLILDEPLSGLDEESMHQFIAYLAELKQAGMTMIISSHKSVYFKNLITQVISL